MAETRIKGTALRGNFEAAEQLYGAEVVARLTQRLPEEFRRACAGGILHGGWYPIAWIGDFYRALLLELPQVQNAPEAITRLAVERDMKGIYGFLARFVSPEFCIRQAPRVLGTYYKGPSIESRILSAGHAELSFSDCDGFGRMAWREIVAGAQRIFEEAGARNARLVFVTGGREGDTQALVEVRWG